MRNDDNDKYDGNKQLSITRVSSINYCFLWLVVIARINLLRFVWLVPQPSPSTTMLPVLMLLRVSLVAVLSRTKKLPAAMLTRIAFHNGFA